MTNVSVRKNGSDSGSVIEDTQTQTFILIRNIYLIYFYGVFMMCLVQVRDANPTQGHEALVLQYNGRNTTSLLKSWNKKMSEFL